MFKLHLIRSLHVPSTVYSQVSIKACVMLMWWTSFVLGRIITRCSRVTPRTLKLLGGWKNEFEDGLRVTGNSAMDDTHKCVPPLVLCIDHTIFHRLGERCHAHTCISGRFLSFMQLFWAWSRPLRCRDQWIESLVDNVGKPFVIIVLNTSPAIPTSESSFNHTWLGQRDPRADVPARIKRQASSKCAHTQNRIVVKRGGKTLNTKPRYQDIPASVSTCVAWCSLVMVTANQWGCEFTIATTSRYHADC